MSVSESDWWKEAAEADRKAFILLRSERSYGLAAFHAQQAAEKSLKAVCHAGKLPTIGHSVVGLVDKLERKLGVTIPQDVREAAVRLDPHYIQGRYPNGVGGVPDRFYSENLMQEIERWMNTTMSFAASLR
ncbi:MAG: HEPN domain-containing protein [Planctomycetes bacterium]|nr:HEPN domain-containing protein [Planctomycetota bacterium]